jgi:hypothetical protein
LLIGNSGLLDRVLDKEFLRGLKDERNLLKENLCHLIKEEMKDVSNFLANKNFLPTIIFLRLKQIFLG